MLFFGHIATSLLLADATDSDRAATVAGNLVPDVTDKTLGLLKLTPSRWLAHGLPGYLTANVVAFALLDRRRWRSFALGYAGHLICDLWAGGKVPWLAPFQKRRHKQKESKGLRYLAIYLLPEVIGLPVTLRLLRSNNASSAE
jgi:membrane-bound metal-dependent hydrolase YbcI (DUF457 family)